MIHGIPVLGWILGLIVAASLAVPFWICWTVANIGETFAPWLPPVYQSPGFWQCVGVFICASIIKTVFIPSFVSVSQTNEKKS